MGLASAPCSSSSGSGSSRDEDTLQTNTGDSSVEPPHVFHTVADVLGKLDDTLSLTDEQEQEGGTTKTMTSVLLLYESTARHMSALEAEVAVMCLY